MREGQPSQTAQRVAAYRLAFDRLAAPYGDPAADQALSREVAGKATPGSQAMGRYLRARTAFFDRVTVKALERGVTQVVVVGAGYDGRALRYAKPGVRWWEVDHPDTQADKRGRLDHLGLVHDHVTFVPCDLEAGGLAAALVAAGVVADSPALFCCEGVAIYLSPETLGATLAGLRSLATPGTRLAFSLSPTRPDDDQARRQRLQAVLADMGEPPRSVLSGEELAELLTRSRWRSIELSERAQRAGLTMVAPLWAPPDAGQPTTLGRLGLFTERMLYRAGGDTLPDHLAQAYGVTVQRSKELDLGVYRVELAGGRKWIARVYPAHRSVAAVRADAELLVGLGTTGFPAERPADPDPVSQHEGQPVLVTELAPGRALASTPATFERLGQLLGRLHSLPADTPAARRPGGAWHHLVLDASPTQEVAALRALLDDARPRVPPADEPAYQSLVTAAAELDDCADLPHALVHPDFVTRNVLQSSAGEAVVIDWTGAGWGPRLVSLGCLLWASPDGPSCQAALAGYGESITLEPAEVERLGAAMRLRPLVLAGWTFATGRDQLENVAQWWDEQRRRIDMALRPLDRARRSGSRATD